MKRYQWLILQDGSMLLEPTGQSTGGQHACTSTLLWPEGESPSSANSLVVDPCFHVEQIETVRARLEGLGIGFEDIEWFFETHPHADHMYLPPFLPRHGPYCSPGVEWRSPSEAEAAASFSSLDGVPCPGHSPDLRAIRFSASEGEVWIVGDAILDLAWLEAWEFYWPNGYTEDEVVQTWESVATILRTADLVIPGHGSPIVVTAELLDTLLAGFPYAQGSGECLEVAAQLRERLDELSRLE